MDRKNRFVLVASLSLVVLIVGLKTAELMLSMDAPSANDADLVLVRREVPEDQNAFPILEEAGKKVDIPYDDRSELEELLAGKAWDEAKVDGLLCRNAEALALWRQGLARPDLLYSPMRGFMDAEYSWMDLGNVASLNALRLHRQGDDAAAFEEAMQVVRFGRRAIGGQGTLITFLLGQSIREDGLAALRRMLPECRLESSRLAACGRDLSAAGSAWADLADALRGEYAANAGVIEDLSQGKPTGADTGGRRSPVPGFLLQVNRTKGMIAEEMRPAIENTGRPYAAMVWPPRRAVFREGEVPRFPANKLSALEAFATGNGIGKLMFAAMSQDNRPHLKCCCQYDVSAAATRVLVALRAYRTAKGDLPRLLDELVPTYMEAVPRDAFDGAPLRYDRSKKLVYSVGENLTDDGGEGPAYDPAQVEEVKPKDLVFPIAF